MVDLIKEYLESIEGKLRLGKATERTHYSALEALIEAIRPNITALAEPKRIECGAPDFEVSLATRHGPLTIGYV